MADPRIGENICRYAARKEPNGRSTTVSIVLVVEDVAKGRQRSGFERYRFCHPRSLQIFTSSVFGGPSRNPRDTYPFYCTTYPEEWTSVYLDRNYFEIDPVIDLSRTGFLPVDWSNIDRRSPRARSFFKEAVSFDIGRQGLTIPVRGPGGERSLFSATSNLPRSEWRTLLTSTSRDLQVLSHFCTRRRSPYRVCESMASTGSYPGESRSAFNCWQAASFRNVSPQRCRFRRVRCGSISSSRNENSGLQQSIRLSQGQAILK